MTWHLTVNQFIVLGMLERRRRELGGAYVPADGNQVRTLRSLEKRGYARRPGLDGNAWFITDDGAAVIEEERAYRERARRARREHQRGTEAGWDR